MHVGDIISTSGGVQYIGGIPRFMWGGIMSALGNVQYIEVCNVNQRLLSICSPT